MPEWLNETTGHRYWAIPFNMDTLLRTIFQLLSHTRIFPYSLVSFNKYSVILRKPLSVVEKPKFLSQGRQIALSSIGVYLHYKVGSSANNHGV